VILGTGELILWDEFSEKELEHGKLEDILQFWLLPRKPPRQKVGL